MNIVFPKPRGCFFSSSTVTVLVHLAIWAQLGVLTRIFIDKFFQLGCNGDWGPCVAGGIYFRDLPANMLGSFVIGVFAASSTVGLANEKPLALLPADNPWQSNFAVQIGIRTGFCGSLTTFSAWMEELMTEAIANDAWANAIIGLAVGLTAAIISYIVGTHAALFAARFLENEDVLLEQERYRQEEVEAYRRSELGRAGSPAVGGGSGGIMVNGEGGSPVADGGLGRTSIVSLSPRQEALEEAEPDLPRIVLPNAVAAGSHGHSGNGHAAGMSAATGGAEHAIVSSFTLQQQPSSAAAASFEIVVEAGPSGGGIVDKSVFLWTNTVAGVGLALVTAGAAAGVAVETEHEWLRKAWCALLFAPFGCGLRWLLSKWNYKLPGTWAWVPGGTFAANMLGVATSSALQAAQWRADMGYWGRLVTGACASGFAGSLSTVSTLVTEIVKFAEVYPENGHAYSYATATMLGGMAMVCVVFGWVVWT